MKRADYCLVKEAARLIGIHQREVLVQLKIGVLRGRIFGGGWMVERRHLAEISSMRRRTEEQDKTQYFQVKLPVDCVAYIDLLCEATELSRSALIDQLVCQAISDIQMEKAP